METTLFLLPIPISESEKSDWIGSSYLDVLKSSSLFFVENVRTARRFIASLKAGILIDDLRFEVLDKDTELSSVRAFIPMILRAGQAVLMSEAGCPGVADPGSLLVAECHKAGISVRPFVGPSSILLALMGSGLSGQNFCFHGYLPIQQDQKKSRLLQLEKESGSLSRTQIFIETPFRNQSLWDTLLETLHPDTRLCVGVDLLGENQFLQQRMVKEWRKLPKPEMHKKPALFLFLA